MKHWITSLRIYLEPASLRMLLLGFAAGLPLPLVMGTLGFRLREAGVSLETITFLYLIGLTYSVKWIWSPLVDSLPIPGLTARLGRRRSWLLVAQCAITLGLVFMAICDAQQHTAAVAAAAVLVAFASATQDVALDAFRIESAQNAAHQAVLVASYQTGYRLALIWAGAGALWLAAWTQQATSAPSYSHHAWQMAYLIMAASMLAGIITVALSPEPQHVAASTAMGRRNLRTWLREVVVVPFADFFSRYQWTGALILALIGVYRISDLVMGAIASPFYVDMRFTKTEVAEVTKLYGVVMTLLGAYIGASLSMRFGIMRIMLLGAISSALTNLLFAWLAGHGHDIRALIMVISADNLASGIATSAFLAYLSNLTNIRYSATQYALFSSLMTLLPKLLAGSSGTFVAAYGYQTFFVASALLGLPVVGLVLLAARICPPIDSTAPDTTSAADSSAAL